jgi:hypothetical protein
VPFTSSIFQLSQKVRFGNFFDVFSSPHVGDYVSFTRHDFSIDPFLFLAYSPAILVAHVPRLAFNFVQAANRVQSLFGQLTFVCRVQIEKLAAGVSHAANLGPAFAVFVLSHQSRSGRRDLSAFP